MGRNIWDTKHKFNGEETYWTQSINFTGNSFSREETYGTVTPSIIFTGIVIHGKKTYGTPSINLTGKKHIGHKA